MVKKVASLLSDAEQDAFSVVVSGRTEHYYRRDIVSSNLDADKMGYLFAGHALRRRALRVIRFG